MLERAFGVGLHEQISDMVRSKSINSVSKCDPTNTKVLMSIKQLQLQSKISVDCTGVGTKISTNFFENIDKFFSKYRQFFWIYTILKNYNICFILKIWF